MPYDSRWPLELPHVSFPSFLFETPKGALANDKKIIIDCKQPDTHYFTLHSLREWSKRMAAGLQAAGLKPGDRVSLVSGNSFWTPVIVMGVLMAGGIYNSADPAATSRELAYQLKDAGSKFVFAAENTMAAVQEAAKQIGIDFSQIFLFEHPSTHFETASKRQESSVDGNAQHWATLLTTPDIGGAFEWEQFASLNLADRTAILLYSSGTTGLPKGVELTHNNMIATTMQMMHMQVSDPTVKERRGLCVVPMYHGLGLVYYVFIALKFNLQSYIMERYNLLDMLKCIQRFKITELVLVPPIMLQIAKHPASRDGTYDLSSVRKVIAGAAPIGAELTQQFEDIWGGRVRVRQGWGMSE